MTIKEDSVVAECVLEAMNKTADLDKDSKKAALVKYFSSCKGTISDMDEGMLRKALNKLEQETAGMSDDQKEIYYRTRLMKHFSTGTVKTKQDYILVV